MSSLIISIVAVVIAATSAFISWRSYSINKKSFENAIRPFLVLEIVPDYNSHINIFTLKVRNDGFTFARNIAFRIKNSNLLTDKVNSVGFIQTGISNLSPKQEISTFLFNAYHKENERLFDLNIDVEITYSFLCNQKETNTYRVSIEPFKGLIQFDSQVESSFKKTAKNVETVAKNINKVADILKNNNFERIDGKQVDKRS